MNATAIALVLTAAFAHATWNLFSKQASAHGAEFFLWIVALCATGFYAPAAAATVLVTHPHLTTLNWVFLIGTGLLHTGYFFFLQRGYAHGDLSLAYPLGRGTGALLAASGGLVLLGERPGFLAAAGIAAVIAGVVVIGLPRRDQRQANSTAVAFASLTGLFIACYTLWDTFAVARLHTPPLLQALAGFPVMAVAFAPLALRAPDRLARLWRTYRWQAVGAGVLSPLAYILVLIALSFAPVSAVAPTREVSVLIGVVLGKRMLGEEGLARRLAAGVAIVAGIIMIALG